MGLEIVTWRDAYFDLDEEPPRKDCLMQTVGWTERRGRWLKIVSEQSMKGKTKRAVTHVPIENVVKRKKLK